MKRSLQESCNGFRLGDEEHFSFTSCWCRLGEDDGRHDWSGVSVTEEWRPLHYQTFTSIRAGGFFSSIPAQQHQHLEHVCTFGTFNYPPFSASSQRLVPVRGQGQRKKPTKLWALVKSLNATDTETKWLANISGHERSAPVNSGCQTRGRRVEAADISLIERTAVEGGWQVLKLFSLSRGRGIKNRLGLKTHHLAPLRLNGSHCDGRALCLFRLWTGESVPAADPFSASLSAKWHVVTLMRGRGCRLSDPQTWARSHSIAPPPPPPWNNDRDKMLSSAEFRRFLTANVIIREERARETSWRGSTARKHSQKHPQIYNLGTLWAFHLLLSYD